MTSFTKDSHLLLSFSPILLLSYPVLFLKLLNICTIEWQICKLDRLFGVFSKSLGRVLIPVVCHDQPKTLGDKISLPQIFLFLKGPEKQLQKKKKKEISSFSIKEEERLAEASGTSPVLVDGLFVLQLSLFSKKIDHSMSNTFY